MAVAIIIGGGAAGMMAASVLADHGMETVLIEKNEKLGKKLYITGKGRCNLTNACDTSDFFKNVVSNPKFLYSSVYGFDPYAVMSYFESKGLKLKTERGNRVFPLSDKSSDVIRTLSDNIINKGVHVILRSEVKRIELKDGGFFGAVLMDGTMVKGDFCLIATGGLSYPSTGSTGDGYRFAKEMGHKVTRLLPSLVSVKTKEDFVKELEGLSLKNIVLTAESQGKVLYSEMGEMLFTHNGISGPLVLSLSALMADRISSGEHISLYIDLKPGLNDKQLDERILKDFSENLNRKFSNSLGKLLPSTIIPVVVRLTGIDPSKQVNSVTQKEREKLLEVIRRFPLEVKCLGGYDEAVITKGGVSVKEIVPSSMASKLAKGVYFIGEVLDVDAYTGGYNLQIAWSTAYAAAMDVLQSKEGMKE